MTILSWLLISFVVLDFIAFIVFFILVKIKGKKKKEVVNDTNNK